MAATAAIKNWFELSLLPERLVVHIAAIKPTVPHTRIGGNTFTTSKPSLFRIVYAIELDKEMVGI